MDRWRNRVAVVTGASAGIGAACCKQLIESGMIVVGLARREERIVALRSGFKDAESQQRLHAIKCDVRKEAEICATFAEIELQFGPVAVLINNAGIVRHTELLKEGNSQDLRDIIETNVMGVAYCTREAFRSMKVQGDGHVVIINSVAGHQVLHFEGMSTNMYPASKHAVTAMTEVYRQEFLMHKTKVRVTSISPGVVDTEIFAAFEGTTTAVPVDVNAFPMLRPEDVADAMIFCLQAPPHVQIHELTIKPVGESF